MGKCGDPLVVNYGIHGKSCKSDHGPFSKADAQRAATEKAASEKASLIPGVSELSQTQKAELAATSHVDKELAWYKKDQFAAKLPAICVDKDAPWKYVAG